MRVFTAPDANAFLEFVQRHAAPVKVTRTVVALRDSGNAVPGLLVQYWAASPRRAGLTWTFTESISADRRGGVDLRDSLLDRLSRDGVSVEIAHRSGAV